MNKGPRSNAPILTGQIVPITFKELEGRVSNLRSRLQPRKSTIDDPFSRTEQVIQRRETIAVDLQTDQATTNFNLPPPQVRQSSATKAFVRSKNSTRMSIQIDSQKKRPLTANKRGFRISSRPAELQSTEGMIKGEKHAMVYKSQINEFKKLYENLASILERESQGGLLAAEEAIGQYLEQIQSGKLAFIDDFIEGRERKLRKVTREARLHESLSVAYLFLELAQKRAEDNRSYLTNFLGYCLSNVLLTTRLYILKEGRPQFEESEFETAMKGVQISSYGAPRTKVEDVMFRIQHNNEILTMMHRKLGQLNPKFQVCIRAFFKMAQRKQISCARCTHDIFEYLALHIHEVELTGLSSVLQVAPRPYCPPPRKQFTLIIEPLGILFQDDRWRPYLFQFMEWTSKHFDVIMWTWEMPYDSEIKKVYGRLQQYLSGRLYRYHCTETDGVWVKDLSRLGRDLDRVVIIDYDRRIYARQPRNGLQLRWRSGRSQGKERGLLLVCQILQQMIKSQGIVEDMLTIYAEQLYNIRGY